MKKIVKTLSIFFLTICALFTITACGSDKDNNKSKDVTNADGMKKYVIQLSIDNYTNYFNVVHQSNINPGLNPKLEFSGCVYNGIYENCVVTYKYSENLTLEPTIEKSFSLNMGGNGSVIIGGWNSVISSVTGTVTYWK